MAIILYALVSLVLSIFGSVVITVAGSLWRTYRRLTSEQQERLDASYGGEE